MKHMLFRYLMTTVLMVCLGLSLVSCQESPDNAVPKRESVTTLEKKISAADIKTANQKLAFSTPSEAMDYFFQTFFSRNFIGAYRTTSPAFSVGHPFEETDLEWHEFYRKITEQGMDRQNLNYRSDFKSTDGDDSGIVLSPNGQLIMRVYLKQLGDEYHRYWTVDNILLLEKTIALETQHIKERVDLTNQPDSKDYREIRPILVARISEQEAVL